MNFIIMDLEWNNTYARKTKGFINEIIEIGAVKLDENLNVIDKFSSVIRSQIGKKLRNDVKQLTNITNEDIRSGEPFTKVFSKFRKWINRDSVILTWGDGDIRVLIDNYKYLNGINTIPFLYRYADLQAYIQTIVNAPKSHQIGLSKAAELLEIDETSYSLHRALDDSLLSAECFKKTYNSKKFETYIKECNDEFYRRLAFKPHPISNINNPLVDKKMLSYTCEICGGDCEQLCNWSYSNQYFRSKYYCPKCDRYVKVAVRFKKYFDRLDVRKNISVIEMPNETENQETTK
ncbi:MAG: exonuclease domain-containing protein [Oscillospiraceae bacterium]|nr:exonuclease domain-containing protein [Oscillospiraceae bacterium]